MSRQHAAGSGTRDAAVGKAASSGEITPDEARDLAGIIDAARRAIDARDAGYRENHSWGRKRRPDAPPLPAPGTADSGS